MTKDALIQIIKEIVQREVKESLPTMLPQILAEVFSQKVAVKPEPEETPKRVITIRPPVGVQPLKIYTKNEKLNKALNETVSTLPREGSAVSSGLDQPPSIMDNVDKIPTSVAKALTKDYSSLMKAIDKKRSGG